MLTDHKDGTVTVSGTRVRLPEAEETPLDREPRFKALKLENAALRAVLARCLPIIESDALMMAYITRFAPLDPESQAKHDSTETESERLVREIPILLGQPKNTK